MTKTAQDVITAAFRRIGVAATDSPLSSDDYTVGYEVYEGLIDELYTRRGVTVLDDIEATPLWTFNPLVQMLSVDLAPFYEREKPEAHWWTGLRRLRGNVFIDDRDDPADTDNDTTVTGVEKDAYDRAAFY